MLIIGLGNPGDEYQGTRHNVGFEVIDTLTSGANAKLKKKKCLSLTAEMVLGSKRVILAKPQTYMNQSGRALRLLVEGFRVGLDDLLIIYDDIDLPLGQIRIRKAGSGSGHKGVNSIIESLGTSEFARLRVGIGTPEEEMDTADYVLSRFKEDEREVIGRAIEVACQAVEEIIISGIDIAMNKFNLKK